MKLLNCNHCGKRKPMFTPELAKKHFLYCSEECQEAHRVERVERSHKEAKTHDPAIRRPKTEGELRAMGMMLHGMSNPSDESGPVKLKPKRPARKKQVRRCGKCGEVGHNARTCDRRQKSDEMKLRSSRLSKKTAMAAPKPIGKRPKAKRVCSKCKKPGHNRRTCPGK